MFDITLAYKDIEELLKDEYEDITEDNIPLTKAEVEAVINTLDEQTLEGMCWICSLILNNAIYNAIEETYERRHPNARH